MGVLEISNGRIVDSQVIQLGDEEEFISIPLEPIDKRKYDRAKIKKETQQAIDKYYEKGGR